MYEIQFGEWLPDRADYKNPGLIDCSDVYPGGGGYRPFGSAVAQSATTTETVTSAQMFFDNSSNAVVFGGSSTRLLTDRSGTVTETTGYNSTSGGWDFERYKELVVAVSIENDPQYLTDIDTDDTYSTLSDAPKAACIGRVDDFLVLGDLVDIEVGTPTVPHRLRWSAKNDPTASWATDRATMAGYQDLDPKDGRIVAIVGGRSGLVFQERAIRRMVFVGAPRVFEFPYVSVDKGAIAGKSAVTIGADTFFLSQEGFWRTNGADIENIGAGRVNEWFADAVDDANVKMTHGAINWPEKSIVWAFYEPSGARYTKEIIYNFAVDKWSYATLECDYLVQTQVNAQTLGSLAALFPSGLGTMSAYTLGAAEWRAKDLSFAAYIESGSGSDFATLDGTARAASFLTGESMITPGRRSRITGVWPGLETISALVTTQVRSRAQEGGTTSVTASTVRGADGFCPHNVDNWIHAARVDVPAGTDWTNATHVIVRAKASGLR